MFRAIISVCTLGRSSGAASGAASGASSGPGALRCILRLVKFAGTGAQPKAIGRGDQIAAAQGALPEVKGPGAQQ